MHPAELQKLEFHRALKLIPRCAPESEAARAVENSVRGLGRVLDPVKLCDGFLVDGRLRIRSALLAKINDVPTADVEEKDVASVVLHSLLARRHYTQSGRAYLAAPLVREVLLESQRRSIEAAHAFVRGAKQDAVSALADVRDTNELAESLGICRRYLVMAVEIHKKFARHPALRATWEPKILSGEMRLDQVQQALAGKIEALKGNTHPQGRHEQLLLELLDMAPHRMALDRWKTMDDEQKANIVSRFESKFLPSLPIELLEATESYLRKCYAEAR